MKWLYLNLDLKNIYRNFIYIILGIYIIGFDISITISISIKILNEYNFYLIKYGFFLILILIVFIYVITVKHDKYLPFSTPTEIIRQPIMSDNIDLYIYNKNIKISLENELNNINNSNIILINNINLLNNISKSNLNTIIELTNELNEIKKLIDDNINSINNIDQKYFLNNSLRPLLIFDQVNTELQIKLSNKLQFDISNILIVNKLLSKIK